ncbi:hypothetical protein GCM10027073_46390 [Streptomyces chlorus]
MRLGREAPLGREAGIHTLGGASFRPRTDVLSLMASRSSRFSRRRSGQIVHRAPLPVRGLRRPRADLPRDMRAVRGSAGSAGSVRQTWGAKTE